MKLIKEEPDADADVSAMHARLVDSLSHSYPGNSLSKALASMETDDSDPLSASCFAELRLEKVKREDLDPDVAELEAAMADDELTCLSWLQDSDLLKNIKTGEHSICTSPPPADEQHKENAQALNGSAHPPHIPYNPQKHVNSKPPYSFSCLIFMAVEDSPDKKLPVKDIYNWILTHFPYFQNAPTGWKNSVRHNLSLNKCFKKVEKEKGSSIGKGSLWMIDPDFRPNLLQALRKTPYHPYHQLQMFSNTGLNTNASNTNTAFTGVTRLSPFAARNTNVNTPSPHLFPFLSRRLAQSNGLPSQGLDGADIDVANTLVSLKLAAESRRPLHARNSLTNGARSRSPSPPEFGSEREKEILKQKQLRTVPPRSSSGTVESIVVTSVPSEDHTYSLTAEAVAARHGKLSPASSIDEAYEFGAAADRSTSDMEYSDFDEDDVSDEETEAVYRAALQRIKLDAAAAVAAVPSITDRIVRDAEEEKKVAEGADALLNLAGIKTERGSPALSPNSANNNNNIESVKDLSMVQVKKEPIEEDTEQMDES